MTDKYTVYPETLKTRIGNVNKYYEDRAKEEKRWIALTPEQQEAEIKEAERLEALSPEEREAEIKKLEAAKPPADNPPPAEETVDSLKEKLEKTEQTLATLQGKYEKEPAEMQRQNNFLTDQIRLLQQEVLGLKEQIKKPAEPPPKKVSLSEALKEDIDELKKELDAPIVDRIIKINERVFELAKEEAQQSISEVASKVDGKLAVSAKERFDKDVLEAYPDWEKMWKTPEFQEFLQEEDGLTGVERYALIEDAFKKLNSRRVLKAFDLFTGKKKPPVDDVKPNLDGDKLKSRLSPPASASPGGPTPSKRPNQMTPPEARQALVTLSANYSRGQYKGSKEEYDKEYARLHTIAKQPQGTG